MSQRLTDEQLRDWLYSIAPEAWEERSAVTELLALRAENEWLREALKRAEHIAREHAERARRGAALATRRSRELWNEQKIAAISIAAQIAALKDAPQ